MPFVLLEAVKQHFCAAITMVALSVAFPVIAAEIRIGGTGNALGTMRLLAAAYEKENPDNKVVVLESIGTSGALKAVPKGVIDIGLSSRPLTEDEAQNGLKAIEYARTATVFAVPLESAVIALTTDQLADIYSGKMLRWLDGTPIRPILRQPGDDNVRQVAGISPAIKEALLMAEKRPGLPFAVTDQESADKAETIPGSLSISTLALILSEKRRLRPLSFNGVDATVENLTSGRYSLIKNFYFVVPTAPSPAALSFVNFVASPPAAEILRQTGNIIP